MARFGIGEVYREVSGESLTAFQKDESALDEVSARLRQTSNKVPSTAIRICLVKYASARGAALPDQRGIDILSDMAHSYSDLVPIPSVRGEFDLDEARRVTGFLQACFKSIERLNNKPVMGSIPRLPREAVTKLLDFYIDHDIRSFYVDFDGKMPDQLKLRHVLARLSERRVLSSSLLIGVNARPGRLLRNASAILSKDFIAFGYGLDVLGGRHFRTFGAGARSLRGKVRAAADAQSENRRRLFSRRDYGYHRADDESTLRALYPRKSAVSLGALCSPNYGLYGPLFNMEQQAEEAATLASRMRQLARGESILDYVATKALAREELPRLRTPKQTDLRRFGG